MSVMTRVSVLLFAAAVMTSCVPASQAGAPIANRSAGNITPDEWANVIAMDQKAVNAGVLAPEIIPIDLTLSKMIPEGQVIVASHDQAKARDWSRRYHALIARRNELDQKSAAAHPIHFNAVQSDPCLSPMGKDICTPPPPVQTQQMCSVNYGDTVGLVPCG
ncbi:hypothetical protein G6M50_16350 [Agrobacterium rhizogenes]|nr:hypothetical protein [Rhizobium rhizogenes]NTJ79358.1 hypothetical protein [Rhizobium rhizogenes]